jgi:hypothetical protein
MSETAASLNTTREAAWERWHDLDGEDAATSVALQVKVNTPADS